MKNDENEYIAAYKDKNFFIKIGYNKELKFISIRQECNETISRLKINDNNELDILISLLLNVKNETLKNKN